MAVIFPVSEYEKLLYFTLQTCAEKGTVLLSTSLAWPAVAGCSRAETFSQLGAIYFAQPCRDNYFMEHSTTYFSLRVWLHNSHLGTPPIACASFAEPLRYKFALYCDWYLFRTLTQIYQNRKIILSNFFFEHFPKMQRDTMWLRTWPTSARKIMKIIIIPLVTRLAQINGKIEPTRQHTDGHTGGIDLNRVAT